MIIAVCDPKGIAIEAIKTILYHDKGLSDRISRIYEFWNMEQLLDASRDSSFDCIVFPNYCNSHNSVVCSLSCGYNRFPLVEHDPRYTLIVRDILYWETARSLWTQYLKAIPGKEEKVKRAIRGILADYEKEERDIIYLESKNHCVLVHLDGIRQTPEGSPSFYATLDEAEHEFASSAFLRIHKSYLINGDHILQMSNYKVLLDTGMTLKGSRKYFSKAKFLEFYNRDKGRKALNLTEKYKNKRAGNEENKPSGKRARKCCIRLLALSAKLEISPRAMVPTVRFTMTTSCCTV